MTVEMERYEKRTMQEALRHLSHAYESIDQAVQALREAKAAELAEETDQLQDFILQAQTQLIEAINERF